MVFVPESPTGPSPPSWGVQCRRSVVKSATTAIAVQERALGRARRPKQCLLARRPALRQTVLILLREEWSPEQIVGHLRRHHGDDPGMETSHETIYRSVYTTRWKVIPRKLCKRLRPGRPIRKNKRHTVKGQWRSQITDAQPIEERPQAAADRSEFGHLEGDLVIGSNNSQVATLVDRKSRGILAEKLKDFGVRRCKCCAESDVAHQSRQLGVSCLGPEPNVEVVALVAEDQIEVRRSEPAKDDRQPRSVLLPDAQVQTGPILMQICLTGAVLRLEVPAATPHPAAVRQVDLDI